jgi:thiol:disulfide interchange protein DsbD
MQTPVIRFLSLITAMLAMLPPSAAQQSETLRDQHVEAVMVSEHTHLQPGRPTRLGLLLRHDPGWHTYWKSTATGYATSINWDLPQGFTVSDIAWPTPKIYEFQGWTEYVYEGETLLMVTLTPPDALPEEPVEIAFHAEWLMCEAVCIPGEVRSTLTLPVENTTPQPAPGWAGRFAQTDRQLPAPPDGYALKAWRSGDAVVLELGGDLPDSVTFFDDQALFEPRPVTPVERIDGATLRVRLDLDPAASGMPDRLTGVLKADPGWPAIDGRPSISVDVPIAAAAPAAGAARIGLGILLLAFAGGLILNLMPCVFPVLGIKIMGFVGQAGESRGKVVGHGLVFTAGVLISFWILAAVLIALRSGGSQLGWGFQLQSPGFVLALTYILFAFGLNMSGLFEFGQSAVGVGSNLTARSGFAGSFFSGVLATVVATPCAAPFLAPALGAALALPPLASLLVFTFIAIGLATPYLLLSTFPGLIRHMPRPGPWMETFKQFMSFLLYATVGFLIWVLAGQLTDAGGYTSASLLWVLLSLVLLAFALWVYGRWGAFHRPKRVRRSGVLTAVLLLALALWSGFAGTRPISGDGPAIEWQAWEPGKAEALAQQGDFVYVDFTARWCVTCQTNKAAVFSSGEVRDRFTGKSGPGVIALKADWTNRDPRISAALAAFGRSAVPFNLIYAPGLDAPVILPELLTPGIVLDALERSAAQ